MVKTKEVKEWRVYQPEVTLRPVEHTRETLAKWTEWLQDPDVHLWMTGDLPHTPAEINQWLYNATHDPRRHYFTIIADGQMVGIVNLRQDQEPKTTAEIGIVIGDPMMRNRGIGKETIKQVLEKAKNEFKIEKVRAHIRPDNEKSLYLFAGQGFTFVSNVTINAIPMLRFEKMIQ